MCDANDLLPVLQLYLHDQNDMIILRPQRCFHTWALLAAVHKRLILCVQVYASTMHQQVRTQVLASILRIIYFNSPDVLRYGGQPCLWLPPSPLYLNPCSTVSWAVLG